MPGVSDARLDAATALRSLANAFHAHEVSDTVLARVAAEAVALRVELEAGPRRERIIPSFDDLASMGGPGKRPGPEGLPDRAVVGAANPLSVEVETSVEGDVAVAQVVFGAAFEGAPGRVHGGMVAAVLDDLSGYALAFEGAPGFTGTLEVVYRAPVPIERVIEFRTWVRGRERRKLFVEAEARLDGQLLVTAKLTMILVDPAHFRTPVSDLLERGATKPS